MRRLAGIVWRFAALFILMTSAAQGQGQKQFRLSANILDAPRFGSVRLMQEAKPAPPGGATNGQTATAPKPSTAHKFWDKQNILLFAGAGAARGLDFASTLNMRRRGVNEELLNNDVVDNHAEFAAIEAATVAANVGLSYLWHWTGHHKLERWTSYIHIGVTVAGAGRNYALKTVHAN